MTPPRPRQAIYLWKLPPVSRIFTIFDGMSEIQRMLIGRAVAGLGGR